MRLHSQDIKNNSFIVDGDGLSVCENDIYVSNTKILTPQNKITFEK